MRSDQGGERSGRAEVERLAESLYRREHRRLLAMARRNSSCREDAEEALQDAFVLFIDHFDPAGEAPALAWLVLTLKRRCWALYHQRQRRARREPERRIPPAGRSAAPEEMAEVAESVARVRRLLEGLKPAERRALTLLALGYSYREIGDLSGWTYTKVNRSIAEGRARLRAQSQDEAPSQPRRMAG